MKKDTIYIDNDDEITSITDKVQSAKGDIIALVLPKRCTVLQSLVNMKILNKAANNSNKKVVLITSEAALLPVAGAAGLYVSKTLQSKPAIPPAPNYGDDAVTAVNEADDEPEIDGTKSVGELAGATAVVAVAKANSIDEEAPIELGDDEPNKDIGNPKDGKKKTDKKNRKLKVPNFDSFRIKLFAGIAGVILLAVLWYVANNVLPRATITVVTENNTVPVSLSITASTSAQSINVDTNTVPAQTKSIDKTESKKFSATGQKNNGNKASGTMTIYNCTDNTATIPAGTLFSSGGFSFATTADATVPGSNFTSGGNCKNDGSLSGVPVMATTGGSQYNLSSGRTYTSNYSSKVTGKGSAMGGGTDSMVKVVSASDCDTAKNELLNTKTDGYKTELANQLTAAGFTPIPDTFTVEPKKVSCSPDVGAEATEATATVTFKASMTGVNSAGLNQLIETTVSKSLKGSQSIIDSGAKAATVTVTERKANGDVAVSVQAKAQVGVKQDADAIAVSVAGKKRGDTTSTIEALPGVTDVTVDYKPFWVSKTPKNVKHIKVVFVNNGNK